MSMMQDAFEGSLDNADMCNQLTVKNVDTCNL